MSETATATTRVTTTTTSCLRVCAHVCVEDAKQIHTYAECSADSTSVRYISRMRFSQHTRTCLALCLSLIANRQSLIASHSYDRLASTRQIPLPFSFSLPLNCAEMPTCNSSSSDDFLDAHQVVALCGSARAYNSKVVGYCISKMYLYLCLHLLYLYLLLSPLLLAVACCCCRCCLARMSRGACCRRLTHCLCAVRGSTT